nr:uncharacterized protein LOC109192376 [Ipomoea batatas]
MMKSIRICATYSKIPTANLSENLSTMATNPVPQGNHPSNVEEQENLKKPTLAQLAKQTHTRQILHVPDLLNVVDRKSLGNQRLCTYQFSGIYEEDVAEFYLHSSIDNLSIKSIVNETHVEIMPSDLRDIFDLLETDLERSSLDEIKTQKIALMNGVWQGIKFNWAEYVYHNIALCKNAKPDKPDKPDETFVLKKLQQHVGYGTLKPRKPTEASTTRKDTAGSDAPKKKRGRLTKITSRIFEGLGSNEAPLPYPPSLPTENVFTNNEALISLLQIEGLDSQLEANILEKGSEPFFDEDPSLAIEMLMELGILATAIQMSTIEKVYTNKVHAKLARSKEKLLVMEEIEEQDVEPITVPKQDQVTVVVENLVEACVINEAQFEVPVEDLVEEPVEKETTTEVEEQVMIPNVTS